MRLRPASRRGRRVLAVLVLVVALVVAATARLFVWSPVDAPRRSDAVVALGGDPGQKRAHHAIALAQAGYAPVAVISLGGNPPVRCPAHVPGITIICFRAHPLDTRGEAEFVGTLAARRHWTRLIIVPERSQATRARLLFKRCTSAQLVVAPVDDPVSALPYDIAYEWAALAKALVVRRSC